MRKPLTLIILFGVSLFLFLSPLSSKINFYQNDDWVYYKMVENFMRGDFKLASISAPTFYTQGLIATFFSIIFGINHLPYLTLLFSVLNFMLVSFICYRFLLKKLGISLLAGLLVFVTPWHMYSVWGFMTENYFLSFLLVSILFFLYFDEQKKQKYFVLLFLFSFLSLLLRQVALVIPLSVFLYYLCKRDFKLTCLAGVLLFIESLFYFYLFPKTPEMLSKSLQFQHLLDFNYAYSLVYGAFLMLTAVTIPFILIALDYSHKKKSYKWYVLFLAICVALYYIFNRFYKPMSVSWGEFPYLENVWERKGFYPRGILGTKYYFKGIFILYRYWDVAAKLFFSGFAAYFVVFKRKVVNFFFIFIVCYMGLMVVTETFYDRYLLVLVPITVFYFLSFETKITYTKTAFLAIFVLFMGFLSYQFSMDFVLSNRYVWDKSLELVQNQNIIPNKIQGTNAWKLTSRNLEKNYMYDFSFDSQKVNKDYATSYNLVDTGEINFPFSLFLEPKIYLYEKKL